MGKNDNIQIGVIGAGFIGRVHMEMFAAQDGAKVVGVTDTIRSLAERASSQFGVPRIFDSAEELIESPEIDAVVVGVPNSQHRTLAVHALEAGKHTLLEKPMAINGTEARAIVEAQKKSGRTLMIGHHMRWSEPSRQSKQLVDAGELGEIYNVKASMLRRKGIPGWGSWFTRKQEAGGGPLIDIGVHILDLSLWFLGNPWPVSVFGSTYAQFGPHKRGIGTWGTPQWDGTFDVEDLGTAMIKLDSGATLTLEVSWAVNTDSTNDYFIHLMGNEGGISLYNDRLVLSGQKFDRAYDIPVNSSGKEENPRLLLSRHFLECVREGKKPISDGISGLVNSTIIDAIYESADSGDAVKLDWSFLEK